MSADDVVVRHETDGDEVFELANLSTARTGVTGVIYISTRQGAHGPRVRYFERAGRTQPSFSVSIEAHPKVLVTSLPDRVVARMAPEVIRWVTLNEAELLAFWDHGDSWLDEEVEAMKARLARI